MPVPPHEASAALGRLDALVTVAGATTPLLSSAGCHAEGADDASGQRPVLLHGPGTLGRAVLDALPAAGIPRVLVLDASRITHGAALRREVARAQVVLCCTDGPDPLTGALARACESESVPLVTAELDDTEARLAPAGVCGLCASRHRASRDPVAAIVARSLEGPRPRLPRWGHRWRGVLLAGVARLAALAVRDALDAGGARLPGATRMVTIAAVTGEPRAIPVSAHHRCPRCFPAVHAGRSALRRAIERRWQARWDCPPGTPPPLGEVRTRLEALVGQEYGLFEPPRHATAAARAALGRFFASRGVDPAAHALAGAHNVAVARPTVSRGRATPVLTGALDFDDPAAAEALALVEGLERLFTLDEGDPARIVRARHRTVRDEALDPGDASLYTGAQYREPGFPLRPFDPGQVLPWVWGMRLADRRPLLVPRDLVLAPGRRPALFQPTSSGGACHTSLHHAVLNGLLEIVERDALMATWLGRLSRPRVVPGPGDPDPFGLRQTLAALGMDCALVDITTDVDVPVLLAALTDRHDPDLFLVDMVAALDPEAQLRKLSRELAQFLHPHLVAPGFFRTVATGSGDPADVRTLPDHPGFYQHRERIPEAAFLVASGETRPLGHGAYAPGASDAAAEVGVLVTRLASRGHEVIVVDCTVPLLERLGLHAVKVLVPGLLPLTAGHRLRTLGARRARELPRRLGLADHDLTPGELNPWPHPFW